MRDSLPSNEQALCLALTILLENGLDEEARRVMESSPQRFLLKYHRDREGVLDLLRARSKDDSVVVRVTGPVALPRTGPDHKYPNQTWAEDATWEGILLVLRPGRFRCYCVRDAERFTEEELEAAFLRVGWYGGVLPVADIYPEGIVNWATKEPQLPNIEVAYPTEVDMLAAHADFYERPK